MDRRYEKELNLYEEDETRLEKLKEAYRQIADYLDGKMEEGDETIKGYNHNFDI